MYEPHCEIGTGLDVVCVRSCYHCLRLAFSNPCGGAKHTRPEWRVAQTFERKMNWILGAPLFRVLCERVGGSAGLLWLCDDAPERSS